MTVRGYGDEYSIGPAAVQNDGITPFLHASPERAKVSGPKILSPGPVALAVALFHSGMPPQPPWLLWRGQAFHRLDSYKFRAIFRGSDVAATLSCFGLKG